MRCCSSCSPLPLNFFLTLTKMRPCSIVFSPLAPLITLPSLRGEETTDLLAPGRVPSDVRLSGREFSQKGRTFSPFLFRGPPLTLLLLFPLVVFLLFSIIENFFLPSPGYLATITLPQRPSPRLSSKDRTVSKDAVYADSQDSQSLRKEISLLTLEEVNSPSLPFSFFFGYHD